MEQKQQQQIEHSRTSSHPIRIYPRKQSSTEPRTILVPPADTVSASPIVPLPTHTFPDEAWVSSSQSTPTADKTSAVLSNETTIFNAPDETAPTSVQSTPTTSIKHSTPVQSLKDNVSPTTSKKPLVADAAKFSTKDASIPEPIATDLHTRHKPSSSKHVSNNLDVYGYYPSHRDEETPYIKPTPRRTSETLDAFSGSNIAAGHTKASSISAKEEPDQPRASDFYKSDSTAIGYDSQYKKSVPYSGRASPKLEPTDTSASKLHSTDVHRRLQVEQSHDATTGINDLKQDADRFMSTQQGKPRNDVKQYPSQDSEQATSHPLPEEPMNMELVQRQDNATRRPYTDQRSGGVVEDKEYSDQRSASLPPSAQVHGTTPSRQAAAKDAHSRIPSQAGYPGGQDTNKQPIEPASVPRKRAVQGARGTLGESNAADSTMSSERFSDTARFSLPRQDLGGVHDTTAPVEKRYPGTKGTSKQVKDKVSTPWQMTDHDTEDTTEETKVSDSSSSQLQPSSFQMSDAPSWKQKDGHSATSAIQEKHANVEQTTGISRDVAFKPKQTIGQDDQDTFKETKSGGPSLLGDQQLDTWQATSTLPEQEVNQDGRSVAPPSQTRYPSSTTPSKIRYQIAKDARKQQGGTAPTPKKKAAQDDNENSEESKTSHEVASIEQPLNAWRVVPISPRRQEVEDSSRTSTSFQTRYPDNEEDMQIADTASASRQIAPDGGFEEIKFADSKTSAKPLYTERADLPFPRQATAEDAQDEVKQSRVTIPQSQKMVARDTQDTHGKRKISTPGDQSLDRLQAIPQSRPATAKYVHSATGETVQSPEILDITKKSRGTFEETEDPDSTLPRAQSFGARDAQRTNGESRTPTFDQRLDFSRQLQPDAQDSFQLSKLSAIERQGLGSSSLQERDAKYAQATTSKEKSISTETHREMIKRETQGSIKMDKAASIYQKKPPVAQDNKEQAQIIEADEKANGSTPRHQQASDMHTLDEKLNTTALANAETRYNFGAEEPYRKDATDDQKLVPPLRSKEPPSQVQPTFKSFQEAASHGGLSTRPSTIEQWQRASVPLNDITSSSRDDEIGMATIDQKLTPMSQQETPSANGVDQMAKESGDQRVELPVPTEAETSGVQIASPSFPGASTAHHTTIDDKRGKQSIIDERVGEPTKSQSSTPYSAPAHAKRATPDIHGIGGSELVSTPDGQISEDAKTRHDQATLQEDVHDAKLPTHDVAKDTFKETKVTDSKPSSAKPTYTQRHAPTPRHAEVENTRDKGAKSRETLPDRQKMVERRAGTAGEKVSYHLKAIAPSRQAPTQDALGATSDTIQSPDILVTSKKSIGTYEEAKGPGSMLSKAQSLGAQDAQHTTGESTAPTAGQRKDVSAKPQPDVPDGLKESKLLAADWNGLHSSSSEGKDAIETKTTIGGERSFSPEWLRETSKKSGSATPKEHPTDSQGSVKEEKTSSIYQKKPLVAQDSHGQAQTIPVGEKADGSTPKHQQASDAPNTFDEKLNASEPAREKTHDDFSTVDPPYREDTTYDQKVAPPLLSRELTSLVQPPAGPSHDAALHGDLSGKPSTIDQWQRTSMPLHDMTTSSGDDEASTVDLKSTPMKQQESGDQRVEPPIPIQAETSGVQHASPSFPGASVDDHATIGNKYAKQPIIDERFGKPIQMQTSSADAHPASEPTKRAAPEGHEIGDVELVSTPDDQISKATKARDDAATVREDVYDVNLSTHDVGKNTFKEAKIADSAPSSAKPIYTQQPVLTPSRQTQIEEARDRRIQSRETIPEQRKMVERKTGISGEQSSDHQEAIRPSRQVAAAKDAPTGDRIQPPYIPDSSMESRGTFEEAIGSTVRKAQALDAQDSQLTRGESTMPTADERKDWKDAKDDETIMTEEKSFSTERLREMFQESESTTPKTQPTDSHGYTTVNKTSPVYQKGPLATQESEEAQIIQAGEKVDSSAPEREESSSAPYTYDEKLSASAPARADIRDDHSAEEEHKRYTADDQKVAPSLSSKEPASQVQPLTEPLQKAVPDGDSPSKSFTIEPIDQWQRASAPLHGVSPDSGGAEVAMTSNNDQKLIPTSQEATLSSAVPVGAEISDVRRTAPSLPEPAGADDATIDDKFAKQTNVDERVGAPMQMQESIKAAHPASASTKRTTPDSHEAGDLKLARTPEGQMLESAKATQDSPTIHGDVRDANLSTYDAAIDKKTSTYQALAPASTQAQPTEETPHDSDSSQYVNTGDSEKPELAKPIVTYQESPTPIAVPTSTDTQRAGTLPAVVGHSQQKSAPSDKGSAHAAQRLSSVEPTKADSDVSAAHYTNAPQIIVQQQARPSAPSTIGIPASDTQGVIRKFQEVTPESHRTDDPGTPFFPSQEHVSHASQAIPGQVEMTPPPGATISPTSDTQLDSAEVQEVNPNEQQAGESITPLFSSGKQGSHVGSAFGPGEVGPADKKFSPSDLELPHSAEQHTSGKPRKEQTVVPTAEQIKEQPTIIGQQDTPVTREALTSEDALDITGTHGDVQPIGTIEPNRRPLSVQGEKPTSATQAPPPHVAKGSPGTEAISTDALANVQSLKSSTTSDARGITPRSTPGDVAVAEQKSFPSGQDSAYPAQPLFSSEPRSKEIGDLAPSTQLNSTTEPRNGDSVVATPDQAKDSQTTPGQQVKLSASSSYTQRPSGILQEDELADNSSEVKSSKPPSLVREGKPAAAGPVSALDRKHVSAPDQVIVDEQKFALSGQGSAPTTYPAPAPGTQYGTELHKADVDGQKFASSGKDSVRSVQPSFSNEPTKEDTVVAATDQTSTLEKRIDQNDTAPARDKAKTPFSGTLDASRETQKSTDDDHIDQKLAGQGRVSPYRDISEPPEGPHSDVVDKDTTLGSSQAETSNTRPDSTPTAGDARFSSGDVPEASSLPETQDLQGSAYAQSTPTDSLGKIESPGHLSTDQVMAPMMSLSVPSVAPLGTNSVQPPQQASMASTVDQESVPDTQHGIRQDQEPIHTLKSSSSADEPRNEEANATIGDQQNVPQGTETTDQNQVKGPSPDARETLRKDPQPSHDDDHISNSVNPFVVHEEKVSHAGRASEGPSSELNGAVVDKKMTFPSSQAQTSSTGPESTPISGDTRLTSADVPAISSLQNEEGHTPAATQIPTPQAPLDSASTQNVPADSLRKISSATLSDAPLGTKPDQVSAHASEPPFSAEPSNEASHAGRASESHEGTTPEVRSPVVDAKTTLPSSKVQTTNTGPDSSPISGDVLDRSSLQNHEAQTSASTQAPTVQAQDSTSTKNEPVDSLGTNSLQPSEEASFDFLSEEKPTATQDNQAKTLPNSDRLTSEIIGQSESADSKGMDSQENFKGASTNVNPKMQQQIEQFDTQSFNKDGTKEAEGTVRSNISTTFEDHQKQPSWPKGSMDLSDEPENQQQTDQAISQSLGGNENQAEQSKAHSTETGGPEDMEPSEITNQKNNRISQMETSDHSRKEASGLQWLGETAKDAPNLTEDAPGDVQAITKSKESSRSSEDSKVQLESEDRTGETVASRSETGQPREGDLPANSYQNNSSQSQEESSDKADKQSSRGIQNKDRDSSRLDGSTDPTKPGDMED